MVRGFLQAVAFSFAAVTAADTDSKTITAIVTLNNDDIPPVQLEPRMQAYCLLKNLPLWNGEIEKADSSYGLNVLQMRARVHTKLGTKDIWREVLFLPSSVTPGEIMIGLTVREDGKENLVNGLTFHMKRDGEIGQILAGPRINSKMADPRGKLAELVDAVKKCIFKNLNATAVKAKLRGLSFNQADYG